jgi:hypothetical protein
MRDGIKPSAHGAVCAMLAIGLGGCGVGDDVRPVFGSRSTASEADGRSPVELGAAHFHAGRFGLAIKYFQMAVAHDATSVRAANGLAASYDRIGRFDLAERYYRQALNLAPRSPESLNNLGYSYFLRRKYDLALAYLSEARAYDGGEELIAANIILAERSLAGAPNWHVAERSSHAAARIGNLARHPAALPAFSRIQPITPHVQSLDLSSPIVSDGGAVLTQASIVLRHAAFDLIEPMLARAQFDAAPLAERLAAPAVLTLGNSEQDVPASDAAVVRHPLIEVSNGTGRAGMAARMREFLASNSVDILRLSNAESYTKRHSTLFYRDGWKARAVQVAQVLPTKVRLQLVVDQAADIRIELGADLLNFDANLLSEIRKGDRNA